MAINILISLFIIHYKILCMFFSMGGNFARGGGELCLVGVNSAYGEGEGNPRVPPSVSNPASSSASLELLSWSFFFFPAVLERKKS